MATQTVLSINAGSPYGTITLVATYTETETGVTVTNLRLSSTGTGIQSMSCSVNFDGTTVNMSGTSSASSSISKPFTKTTANQTKDVLITDLVVSVRESSTTSTSISYSSLRRSFTVVALQSYAVTYDANGHGTAPAAQTKYYGVNLALRGTTPTAEGWRFLGWATSSTATSAQYQPGAIYTANEAVTLHAVWVRSYNNPTISSMTVVRCNSSGTETDDGTYFKLTAQWAVDTENVTGNTGTVTGKYKSSAVNSWSSSSVRTITFSSGASGASGTAVAIVSGIDTDTQYDVQVTVTDKDSRTTSRQDVLTRAKFVLDFRAGGGAMGICSAAPAKGLEVGWEAQFDEDVTLLKDLVVSGTITAPQFELAYANSGIATASGNFSLTTQQAYKYGHVCVVRLVVKLAATWNQGTFSNLATLTSAYRPKMGGVLSTNAGDGYLSSSGQCMVRSNNNWGSGGSIELYAIFLT